MPLTQDFTFVPLNRERPELGVDTPYSRARSKLDHCLPPLPPGSSTLLRPLASGISDTRVPSLAQPILITIESFPDHLPNTLSLDVASAFSCDNCALLSLLSVGKPPVLKGVSQSLPSFIPVIASHNPLQNLI